ncbi:hypothetical protein Pcinc_024360 [Petrolisthes cinctipes]|uniref:Uncharacterized protein n=1 Tax=Petrolisthes cinctipes TaxID=88211 RepID=A0AAE1FA42_PETCI|nr:hypothetical protein Pcinc_024360 [Petrolisthes cinctipes]
MNTNVDIFKVKKRNQKYKFKPHLHCNQARLLATTVNGVLATPTHLPGDITSVPSKARENGQNVKIRVGDSKSSEIRQTLADGSLPLPRLPLPALTLPVYITTQAVAGLVANLSSILTSSVLWTGVRQSCEWPGYALAAAATSAGAREI